MSESVPLRACVSSYIGGGWGEEQLSEEFGTPAFVIRGTDFEACRVGNPTRVPYRFHKSSNAAKRLLEPGDICLEAAGGSHDQLVGRVLLIDTYLLDELSSPVICASFCKLLRPNLDRVDPTYLFWVLQAAYHSGLVARYQVQSTGIRNFQLEYFLDDFQVPLPAMAVQQSIGAVLTRFEDLRRNNRQRIDLMEEAARLLYREWFVNFRYPGHEDVPLVDSELGPTPHGWEHITLAGILDTLESGSRPRGGVGDLAAGIPSVGAENINGLGVYDFSKEKFISESFFSSMKRGVAEPYDVLLYKDGAYIGRTAMFGETFPHRRLAINEHVFRLRSKDPVGQCFLYLWLSEQPTLHRVQMLNSNAAQPGISQQKLLTLAMAVPAAEVLGAFEVRVRPIVEAIFCLASQDKVLVEARDLLLPRLVSGDLDISDLDLDLEAAG